jgi:putative transposase
LVDQIRQATNGNNALGDGRFVAELEQMLGRRVTRGKPGRPFKNGDQPSAGLFD